MLRQQVFKIPPASGEVHRSNRLLPHARINSKTTAALLKRHIKSGQSSLPSASFLCCPFRHAPPPRFSLARSENRPHLKKRKKRGKKESCLGPMHFKTERRRRFLPTLLATSSKAPSGLPSFFFFLLLLFGGGGTGGWEPSHSASVQKRRRRTRELELCLLLLLLFLLYTAANVHDL